VKKSVDDKKSFEVLSIGSSGYGGKKKSVDDKKKL